MRLMKRALIVWGAWTAVALLFAIQMHFQTAGSSDPRSWSWILAWQLTGWWGWALFTAPVCAFAAWAVRIRRPAVLIAAHIPMAVVTAVACAGFEGGLKWAMGLWRTPHTFVSGVWDGITIWRTFNVLVYAMVAGLYHAWRATRLEMQLVQARLDALVGQLQPHFLFNTLHTISAFVLEDPKQANRMKAEIVCSVLKRKCGWSWPTSASSRISSLIRCIRFRLSCSRIPSRRIA